VTRIDQLLPRLARRDAVGAHTLEVQAALRSAGIDSDIYAAEWDAEVAGLVHPYLDHRDDDRAWLMYHASVGSHVANWFGARRARKLLDYHNVTPHEYFDAWAPEIAGLLVSGRHQLEDLAPLTAGAFADSSFNEAELTAAGYERTAVVPIMVDVTRGLDVVDTRLCDELRATKRAADWLFVGRLAPNKAQHEVMKAFACYRRTYDAASRLWLVGGDSSAVYRAALERYADDIGLRDAITITGSVSDAQLGAYYDAADVFVCLSQHEGFLVPVLEAMAHGVPVVALAAGAIPETVHHAGVLLDPAASAVEVAAAVHQLLANADARDALVAAGHERVDHFSVARGRERLLEAVAKVVGDSS
jgi:glycosyltransferase involved in cell wall biosynthesis